MCSRPWVKNENLRANLKMGLMPDNLFWKCRKEMGTSVLVMWEKDNTNVQMSAP